MAGLLSYATLITDYLPEAPSDATSQAVLGRALERAERAAAGALGYPGASPTWASATYAHRLILHLLPLGTTPSLYTCRRQSRVNCSGGDTNEDAIPVDIAGIVYRWT